METSSAQRCSERPSARTQPQHTSLFLSPAASRSQESAGKQKVSYQHLPTQRSKITQRQEEQVTQLATAAPFCSHLLAWPCPHPCFPLQPVHRARCTAPELPLLMASVGLLKGLVGEEWHCLNPNPQSAKKGV